MGDLEAIVRNIRRMMEKANERRKAAGQRPWSRRSLSIAAGNETLLRDMEQRSKNPKYVTLVKIAEILECDVADLTGERPDDQVTAEIMKRAADLTPEERQAALDYMDFIRARREKP